MNTKWTWLGSLLIVLVAVLASVISAAYLPPRVVSHWNAQGQPDGTMSRFWALALVPLIMVGITLLLMFIRTTDPLRANIQQFLSFYNGFVLLVNVYLLYVHGLTLAWNLGWHFNLSAALIPAMAVLFYLAGILLKRTKRNWFMGIRTPWTMSSDRVWDQTHRRASLLFKISAVLMLVGLFFPNGFWLFLLAPLFASVIYVVVYSYWLYRRETQAQES